jgi:hypothetical protein
LRKLEIQIEALDTQLVTVNRMVEIVAGVVYYYSLGCNSVQVARALAIKPPAVRQLLWRLHRTWARIQ